MQKTIKIISWIFILSGIALLTIGSDRLPDFYNPGYMAGSAFASALAIMILAWFFKSEDPRKKKARIELQGFILLALALNAVGALGLYKLYLVGFEYDKLVHFMTPLILVLGAVRFRMVWYGRDIGSALKWSLGVVLAGAVGWEIFELLSDVILGTETMGLYGEAVVRDTIIDLVMNVLGAVFATIIVIFYKRKKVEKN